MHNLTTSFLVALIMLVGTLSVADVATAQDELGPLIIDPTNYRPDPGDTVLPLVGIRANSEIVLSSKLGATPDKDGVGLIPESVIVASLLKDATFAKVISDANLPPKEVTIEQIKSAGINLDDALSLSGNDFKSIEPESVEIGTYSGTASFDATAVKNLAAIGAIDFSKGKTLTLGGEPLKVYPFDAEYWSELEPTYEGAQRAKKFQIWQNRDEWQSPFRMIYASSKYPFGGLKDALVVEFGKVTFGKPLVKTGREAGFKVQRAIAEEYDVYLVEFAITFYDIPVTELEELSYRLSLQEDCIAFELAPLRLTAEENITQTVQTPEITIGPLTLGQFFERQVVFKNIRPQVIAYGLREDSFSWSLTNDAVVPGSHIFVAALGIPKGRKEFSLRQSVGAKTKHGIKTAGLVPIYVEGDWLTTENSKIAIKLPSGK